EIIANASTKPVARIEIFKFKRLAAINYALESKNKEIKKKAKAISIKQQKEKTTQKIYEDSYLDMPLFSTITGQSVVESSIGETLNELHPDIKKFLTNSSVIKYKATAGFLEITLTNGYAIQIEPLNGVKVKPGKDIYVTKEVILADGTITKKPVKEHLPPLFQAQKKYTIIDTKSRNGRDIIVTQIG
ncbi:MAG: hypothetical protein AABY22_29030, partial [Nanoarchaeota archaeon]